MSIGPIGAVKGSTKLPREECEDEAEGKAQGSDLGRADRAGACENDAAAFVLQGSMLPLEIFSKVTRGSAPGIVHSSNRLDLCSDLRKMLLKVPEGFHRLLQLLEDMRDVASERFVYALVVAIQTTQCFCQEVVDSTRVVEIAGELCLESPDLALVLLPTLNSFLRSRFQLPIDNLFPASRR